MIPFDVFLFSRGTMVLKKETYFIEFGKNHKILFIIVNI